MPNDHIIIKNSLSRSGYRKVANEVEESVSFIDNSFLCETVDINSKIGIVEEHATLNRCNSPGIDRHITNLGLADYDFSSQHGTQFFDEPAQSIVNETLSVPQNCCEDKPQQHIPKNVDFAFELAKWAVEENISQVSLRKLLNLLRANANANMKKLPKDPRTLLRTPNNTCSREMGNGRYFYFGIATTINNLIQKFKVETSKIISIDLGVNIDGLPLSKSTGDSFWPVLCSVQSVEAIKNEVFPVAIYHGSGKPTAACNIISDFIQESCHLTDNGFSFGSHTVPFKLKMLVCDTPAKSFILSIKGHNGYFACPKCCTEGDFYNNIVCYGDVGFVERTDADFRSRKQEDHHTGVSLFENLPGFDLVKNVPVDYMHVILLGVVKRLLCHKKYGLVFGKPPTKLPARDILAINLNLKSVKKFIPAEFSRRKTRDISEIKKYKATELRLFLLYTGPVILKGILASKIYNNFLILSCATRIMLSDELYQSENLLAYAEDLMKYFITNCKSIYGLDFISLNVHLLLHLADTVRSFGSLDNCSAFPYENFMQILKKKIRKSARPLEQVIRRISENNRFFSSEESIRSLQTSYTLEHNDGPLLPGFSAPQYKKLIGKFVINSNKFGDSFIQLLNGQYFRVKNIAWDCSCNTLKLIGIEYVNAGDFFTRPCASSLLNICVIKRNSNLTSYNIESMKSKILVLPYKNKLICFPLLHI